MDPSDLEKLKATLADQQKQLETLAQSIKQQQKLIDALSANQAQAVPATQPFRRIGGDVASSVPTLTPSAITAPAPKAVQTNTGAAAASPLQLQIGETSIIPIGFMDLTGVWRDRNAASGIGSNFASVPYGNTVAGHLSEFRFSPQNSRLGFRMDANVHGAHVTGYNEFDFLGTSGGNNLGVTNGGFVPRLRLFWVDVRKNNIEFLAGQSWSMMTPNRKGISALPGDLFYSQVIDVNYLIGLTWTRQPGVRVLIHAPKDKVTAGISFENPNQYIGGSAGAPTVTLPNAFTSFAGSVFDNSSNVLNTPNLMPDIIAKVAFDPSQRLHFEVGGIVRAFKDYVQASNQHFTKAGGGGMANVNFGIAKNVRLVSNNFLSDGAGRYLFGTVPDVVVRSDGRISPIHNHSTTDGIELTMKNTLLYAYYGGVWVGRNVALDANGTTPVGYGFTGSPNNHNRSIEEVTLGFNQTIWKDAKWGAVNYMMQYEYATRNPWFVATGQPGGAHDNTIFLNIRYTLPGAPPPAPVK